MCLRGVDLLRRQPCEAEVEELDVTIGQQEHVRRLEIAMRNAFAVRGSQPASDSDGDLNGFPHGQCAILQAFRKRLALQELGDDKMPVALDADVEEREDIWMRQRRHGARLALEAGSAVGISCYIGGQNLDCHVAPESRVACAIHLAHTTGAERRNDLVRA